MSEFNANQLNPDNINWGKKFNKGDGFSANDLNSIVEGILYSEIVGWAVIYKCFLAFLFYKVIKLINLFCVSIGASGLCKEENWDTNDFSKAWMNIYKYEDYIKTEDKGKED